MEKSTQTSTKISFSIPKEVFHCICLSVILIDFFRIGNNYYPQVFLEECKYFVKE